MFLRADQTQQQSSISTFDSSVLGQFLTFLLIAAALIGLSGLGDTGYHVALGLVIIALIYVLLSSHGLSAVNFINTKLGQ